MISFLTIFLKKFFKSNRICSPFKNVLTFLSPFLKSANKEQWHYTCLHHTNQEIFFDQCQSILVVFLVFSLVFSCCVFVSLGILLYLILSPVSDVIIAKRRRAGPLAFIAYFPLENVNKHGFFRYCPHNRFY